MEININYYIFILLPKYKIPELVNPVACHIWLTFQYSLLYFIIYYI